MKITLTPCISYRFDSEPYRYLVLQRPKFLLLFIAGWFYRQSFTLNLFLSNNQKQPEKTHARKQKCRETKTKITVFIYDSPHGPFYNRLGRRHSTLAMACYTALSTPIQIIPREELWLTPNFLFRFFGFDLADRCIKIGIFASRLFQIL